MHLHWQRRASYLDTTSRLRIPARVLDLNCPAYFLHHRENISSSSIL
jgi:hypothetical protein